MMAAEIVIISSELNWAREKEILGFFYYPQYLVSKIASQVIHGENFFFILPFKMSSLLVPFTFYNFNSYFGSLLSF